MQNETPNWGIEPVPERLRVLGALDQTMLWGNLGVSLLVLVIGSLLVPALSLRDALIAVVVGSLIGNAMLGAAGLIGADARVPSMVLLRAPLGRRGSFLPTGLNIVQCLGWATFELIIIAAAAAALSDEILGFRAQWAWTIFFGAAAAALALMGPVGFVRRFVRRFALWAVLASLGYLTWWALYEPDVGELWSAKGEGGMSIWLGIDLVIAITVSWVPLVADYTRFSRGRRSALVGSGVGYFLGRDLDPGNRSLHRRGPRPLRPGRRACRGRRRRPGSRTGPARRHRRRDGRGVRQYLLHGRLGSERRAVGLAAAPHRPRLGRSHHRGADDPAPLLRVVPPAPGLFLRAPLRRAPGRLARQRDALRQGRHLLRPCLPPKR